MTVPKYLFSVQHLVMHAKYYSKAIKLQFSADDVRMRFIFGKAIGTRIMCKFQENYIFLFSVIVSLFAYLCRITST